jgi:hypothetical protein
MLDGKAARSNQARSLHFSGSMFRGSPCHRPVVKKNDTRSSAALRCITVAERHLLGIDDEAGFLTGLAAHGVACPLPSVDVAGDHAVVPVLVARVRTPEQEDPVVHEEQQVRFGNQLERVTEAHGVRVVSRPTQRLNPSRS